MRIDKINNPELQMTLDLDDITAVGIESPWQNRIVIYFNTCRDYFHHYFSDEIVAQKIYEEISHALEHQ